jgi:hypothetical protein
MHPFKKEADASHKSKTGNMGKSGNLDIPIMRAVGENSSKKIATSSASMQHKAQSAADGMKKGGHVGKPKHHKPKAVILAPDPAAVPPDPAMAGAGAGGPPPPSGPPMMPPGGAPPPGQPPMKRGGKVKMMTKGMTGGDNGVGRIERGKAYGLKPLKAD